MNETMMTIVGNVVDTPNLRRTANGHSVASFRVGSTQRRYDRATGEWSDGDKLFVTVTVWRALAENVAQSLERGMPVIVHGRYYQRDYEKDEQLRVTYELDATAVGPDLSWGTAEWKRVARSAAPSFAVDDSGAPADVSDDYIGAVVADDAVVGIDGGDGVVGIDGVDLRTGEVHELAPA